MSNSDARDFADRRPWSFPLGRIFREFCRCPVVEVGVMSGVLDECTVKGWGT